MLQQMILPGFDAAISSPELRDGRKPCASPDGRTRSPSGPDRHPASPSAPQESAQAVTTLATSAPDLSIWSGPPAPLCCLASRSPARTCSDLLQGRVNAVLRERLHGRGSTIYSLASKQQDTPHGRAIFRRRASARRTSGSDASSAPSTCDLPQVGWNTARATDGSNGGPGQTGGALPADAALAGWATARANDSTGDKIPPGREGGIALKQAVQLAGSTDSIRKTVELAGWPTPTCADVNHARGTHEYALRTLARKQPPSNVALFSQLTKDSPARLTASGDLLTGSSAGMSDGGQLNPEHSRWLMGYPAAWGSCGATAMRSCRRQPRSSSTPAAKS